MRNENLGSYLMHFFFSFAINNYSQYQVLFSRTRKYSVPSTYLTYIEGRGEFGISHEQKQCRDSLSQSLEGNSCLWNLSFLACFVDQEKLKEILLKQVNICMYYIHKRKISPVPAIFINKRFALNEMFQQNAQKFAIFYV